MSKPRIGEKNWIQRWTLGTGGFIGEITLQALPSSITFRSVNRCVLLTNLYVHPLRRKLGWAKILVQTVLAYADRNQIDVYLEVRAYGDTPGMENTSLAKFYRGYGFRSYKQVTSEGMIRRAKKKEK